MTTWSIIVIIILSVSVFLLALALYYFVRKSTYIPDKDKEFIEFTIDMYIQYAEDLDIHSPKQHKKIVEQLERIKTKYLKTNDTKKD
jgi:flagellar basal body-associated protein FliL